MSEIPDVLAPVMDESFPIDQSSMEKIQSKHETKDHLKSLIEKFEKIETWTSENNKETLQKHAQKHQIFKKSLKLLKKMMTKK